MKYFEIIFQLVLSVCAVFFLYISIPVFKDILKSAKLEIKNLKKEILKNRTDKIKVDRDFVLDKPNLVYKLIDDIYDGNCSLVGSRRGKAVKISIEGYIIEIDYARIIQPRGGLVVYDGFFDINILILPEQYEILYNELMKIEFPIKKPPQPINIIYPVLTNDSCKQYKVFLEGLPPHFNKINCCKLFETERSRLTIKYWPE